MVRANMAAGHTVPSHGQAQSLNGHANSNQSVNVDTHQQAPAVDQSHPYPHGGHKPAEITLEEVQKVPRHVLAREEEEEEEEEEETYEEEEEEEEGEEEEEEEEAEEEEDSEDSSVDAHAPRPHTPTHLSPLTKIAPPRLNPRKRSSDDLEGDAIPSGPDTGGTGTDTTGGETRVGTPPKRVKMGVYTPRASEERSVRDGADKGSRGTTTTSTPTRNGATTATGTGMEMLDATSTPASRQRKRSSEELDVSGGASPRSKTGEDKQKRLRVEGSTVSVSPPKSRNTRTLAGKASRLTQSPRSTSTPMRASASPPSSMMVTSLDVDVDGIGSLKAGLVNGGELDGLYVFEET